MFLIIRSSYNDNEVLGILDQSEVLGIRVEEPSGENFIRAKLIRIIERTLSTNVMNWYWEEITKAEYETYRYLHGFRVIVRRPWESCAIS